MPRYASVVEGDVCIITSGDMIVEGLVEVSPALDDVPAVRLRYVNDQVIDIVDYTVFYIDPITATKHAVQHDPAWSQLACKWDDVLVKDGTEWRVKVETDDLKKHAAATRYVKENSGIEVNDLWVATDRANQSRMTDIWVTLQTNPDRIIKWKGAGSTWVELDAAQSNAIVQAVHTHVQACFDMEHDVVVQIESGAITTTEQVDAAFATIS